MNQTSSCWPRELITSRQPQSMPQMRPRAHTAHHLIKARGCSSQEHEGWLPARYQRLGWVRGELATFRAEAETMVLPMATALRHSSNEWCCQLGSSAVWRCHSMSARGLHHRPSSIALVARRQETGQYAVQSLHRPPLPEIHRDG